MFRQVAFIGLGVLLIIGGVSAYLSGYDYYQDMTLNNTGTDLTNYQVMFTVNTSSGTSSGSTIYLNSHSESDLDDLRFTSTGDTVYDYWIETNPVMASPYTVFVEIPSIPSGNSTMRVQYDNAGASAYSNGTNTFVFIDDCDTVDTGKWTVTGDVTASGGLITIRGKSSSLSKIVGKVNYSPPIILEYRATFSSQNDATGGIRHDTAPIDGGYFASASPSDLFSTYNEGTVTTTALTLDHVNGKIYGVKYKSSSYCYGQINRNNIATHTTNVPDEAIPIRFAANSPTSTYAVVNLNWVLIRSYADTEPTIPAWSGELLTSTIPVAAFSANVTSGTNPLTVLFTDASTNTPTSWEWSFDDGGANSTSQNPTRTFTSTGTYTITLTATNDDGSGTEEKVDYITVNDPPVTTFPGCAGPPTNLDVDGYYEDVNGNARLDWSDLIVFFTYLEWAKTNEPASLFNFANDGGTLTYADVIALFQEL